jgi:putative ABC transport system ATP-binding protein
MLGVLKDISFTVGYGEVVGLVGRNGVGKTTLLEVLRGTLPPQKGEVRVGQTLVAIGGNHRQTPSVAMISQRPDAGLTPTMTVYENYVIAIGHGMSALQWAYSNRMKNACRDLMARASMGIEHKCHEQSRFLSGGQQQAVSLLLALEAPERLLLMDEPTAALDPFAAATLLDLAISEIRRVHGAVLLVSHRLRDVAERCSRILVLHDGHITREINCALTRVTEQELLVFIANAGNS